MSIKDRLARKTEGLLVTNKEDSQAGGTQTRLRTGPGQMLMVNSLMKESNEKVALLEERLKAFEGSLPVRLIDAKQIHESKWANRIADLTGTPEFIVLKQEIEAAGGNVQPIKVRPAKGSSDKFEIVFGHRRHRACLELGLPVLALIEDVSDQDLFKEMDRENRARQDLSPWEQGKMYRRALNDGLFSSLTELSVALGVDKGNISKALKLADLPEVIVQAFPSPLALQYRWAKVLSDALQSDPQGTLERAKELADMRDSSQSAKDVLELLLGKVNPAKEIDEIVVAGKTVATIVRSGKRISVHFENHLLDTEKLKQLEKVIRDFLGK